MLRVPRGVASSLYRERRQNSPLILNTTLAPELCQTAGPLNANRSKV